MALRRAEAAERAVRRRVRRHRAAADAHVRAEVRTGGVDGAARQHDRRQRAVGAAVDDELDVHRQQPAVARRSPSDAAFATDAAWWSRPCPRAGRKSSSPAGRPSTPGARRARRGSTDIPPCRRTRRPSPSGPRECFSEGRSNSARERPVNVVGTLHRAPHRHAGFGLGDGEHAVRLDVELLLRAGLDTRPRRSAPPCGNAASTSPR